MNPNNLTFNDLMKSLIHTIALTGQNVERTADKGRIERAAEKYDLMEAVLDEALRCVREFKRDYAPPVNESLPKTEVEDFEAAILRDIAAL